MSIRRIESSSKTDLAILQTEIRDSTHRSRLSFRQILVNDVDSIRNMTVRLVEEVASFLLECGKLIFRCLGRFSRRFEFCVDIFESIFGIVQSIISKSVAEMIAIEEVDRPLDSFHVRRHPLQLGRQFRNMSRQTLLCFLGSILEHVTSQLLRQTGAME